MRESTTTMRVALDVSFLDLPPSGSGTYVRSLATALERTFPDDEIIYLRPGWSDERSTALPTPLRRLVTDRRLRRFFWESVGVGRAARWVHPDLLHIPHFSAPVHAAIPFVVTIHDVIPLLLPRYRASRAMRSHLAVMRRTVRRAKLVLTPSQAAASDLSSVLGISAERIRVTPEAVEPRFAPGGEPADLAAVRARYGIRDRYIFNVGGLDVRKNLPVLLEAFAHGLPAFNEPTQLVIAGEAHSSNPIVFPPLPPVVDRLDLGEHVRLIGRVTEAEKLALYQGAAIYVTPSLYEGFGLTPLEAMACGVPTIAANRTSLPEVVGDGGLLVEPESAALAEAIVSVLNDPSVADRLARRGIDRASQFSWERTARLTMAAYREAVGEVR